jgi:uncharacterized membrane protein YhhN
MPNKKTTLFPLYLIISFINLWAGHTNNNTLIFFSKPLLMPVLALWFYFQTREKNSSFRQHFFLFGLLSFLLTHILYISVFFKSVSLKNGFIWKNKWIVIPFLVFFLGFQNYLLPDVEKTMQIPISIYSSVIILMVIAALNWKDYINKQAFKFVFWGALLFMFSDSIIALNKFKSAIPQAHIWVMSLYLLGQYLIVRGNIEMMQK